MEKTLIQLKDICKVYNPGENEVRALDHINLEIMEGELVAIIGQSGSGKSTLMNMLGCLDVPTSGSYYLHGQDVSHLKDNELSAIRNKEIGFIFQDYNLLDTMTLQDNIALPLSLNGVASSTCIQKTKELAAMFGLEEHLKKYPYQLSGGQKQRGAACRALISDPKILFADEPTGALDSKASHDLMECLKMVNDAQKATILMVTHDAFSASYAKDVYILKDGSITCKLSKGNDRKEFYDRIIEMQASMGE